MLRIGFDNEKYLRLQSEKIRERIARFGGKLYLEFGGKLFDDYHASRVLPGFEPDSKVRMLLEMRDEAEIIIVISADDIERSKRRGDLGITYDDDLLRLIDAFKAIGLYVGSVSITHYRGQQAAEQFKKRLEAMGVRVYLQHWIPDYPSNLSFIVSDEGFGKNDYIETSRRLVVVTAPGPGSGKMATCLSQLYHEHKRGVKAGYAKFETFPIWNLPLKHPVNLAYEAATADLDDVNMIDPFHLEAYGETTVNYNRDVEIFPVLNAMFERIYGESPYKSPTDMGVNMAGFCIIDDAACRRASEQEIIRRYYQSLCSLRQGLSEINEIYKLEMLLNQIGAKPTDRAVVPAALARADGRAGGGDGAAERQTHNGQDLVAARGVLGLPAERAQVPGRHPGGRSAHLPGDNRAHPAPQGGAHGQPQPPPAHGRGADRALHLRGDGPERRKGHGAARGPGRGRGALHGHPLPRGRERVPAPGHEPHLRAQVPDQKALPRQEVT